MPDTMETIGQNMDQETAYELIRVQAHHFLAVSPLMRSSFQRYATVWALALTRRMLEIATRWA